MNYEPVGAEAIAVNDQRLTGTSEVRCAGPTVMVNGKVFGPPFVIKAIGDPKTLSAALTMRGGVVESLKYWGIELKIQEVDQMIVPAFNGTFKEEHLKVVKQGGDEKIMMYLFIVGGLVVGIIIGVMSPLEIPPVYAKYTSVALLAALDSVFGGTRAALERIFNLSIFLTGFVFQFTIGRTLGIPGKFCGH